MTQPLTTLTVNLIPKALDAMNRSAEMTGDTKTDTVNRALQCYTAMIDAVHRADETRNLQVLTWQESSEGPKVRVLVGRPGPTKLDRLIVLFGVLLALGLLSVGFIVGALVAGGHGA